MERKITNWRKASASANGEACLEAGTNASGVLVRDTNNRQDTMLTFTPASWNRLVLQLKQ
jgi:hypothetical protein